MRDKVVLPVVHHITVIALELEMLLQRTPTNLWHRFRADLLCQRPDRSGFKVCPRQEFKDVKDDTVIKRVRVVEV